MQQNKTASQRKTINPACWVPTAYFAMGLPFIAINLVSVFMFKDLGISDTQIAFWTSLIMMPWTLKFCGVLFLKCIVRKILRIDYRIIEWCIVWSSSLFFVFRLLFRHKYLYNGSDCL